MMLVLSLGVCSHGLRLKRQVGRSNPYDPFGLHAMVTSKTREVSSQLSGKAKRFYDAGMSFVTFQPINPLINSVSAMLLDKNGFEQVDMQHIAAVVGNGTSDVIVHNADVAKAHPDYNSAIAAIGSYTRGAIGALRAQFNEGLDGLLSKSYKAKGFDCTKQADIDRIYKEVYQIIDQGCDRSTSDKCCGPAGSTWYPGWPGSDIRGKSPQEMSPKQLYTLESCRQTSKLPYCEGYACCNIYPEYPERAAVMYDLSKKLYCITYSEQEDRQYFTARFSYNERDAYTCPKSLRKHA